MDIVDGQKYIPDEIRATEIDRVIENLLQAHNGMNNFYNEPGFLRELCNIIGDPPKIPEFVREKYIYCILNVFLTNRNGKCWAADPIYLELIECFNVDEANYALQLLVNANEFGAKYQFSVCIEQFFRGINALRNKITNPTVQELLQFIDEYKSGIPNLVRSSDLKRILARINN